jgi:hypothetical protein
MNRPTPRERTLALIHLLVEEIDEHLADSDGAFGDLSQAKQRALRSMLLRAAADAIMK